MVFGRVAENTFRRNSSQFGENSVYFYFFNCNLLPHKVRELHTQQLSPEIQHFR